MRGPASDRHLAEAKGLGKQNETKPKRQSKANPNSADQQLRGNGAGRSFTSDGTDCSDPLRLPVGVRGEDRTVPYPALIPGYWAKGGAI